LSVGFVAAQPHCGSAHADVHSAVTKMVEPADRTNWRTD
jgi:hypothetical protein